MSKLTTVNALHAYAEELKARGDPGRRCVTVCGGTGCRANRGLEIASVFKKFLERMGLSNEVEVKITGCHGFCAQGPLVVLLPKGILYVSVTPDDVEEIITSSVQADDVVERLTYKVPGTKDRIANEGDIPFYANQHRLVFARCGKIDPTNIENYIVAGGYSS
ncbi:MAG: (2Fe-2S) ferredoxin domain-containing protein, partial [Planctomycetota bacterium]